jgi:predicted small metal-binding protein
LSILKWAQIHSPFPVTELIMTRKFIDCREIPSEMHCTVAMSADGEDELLQAAVEHAVSVHHHSDTPELRQLFKDGMPPENLPMTGQAASTGATASRHH